MPDSPPAIPPDALDEAALRARLAERGLSLRPEDAAPTLATARFLLRAAALVRAGAA